MAATVSREFALFKNGVEIPNTRFEAMDPNVNLITANPIVSYTSFQQVKGQAMIDIGSATDNIELRLVSVVSTTLQASDSAAVIASMNIVKVSA